MEDPLRCYRGKEEDTLNCGGMIVRPLHQWEYTTTTISQNATPRAIDRYEGSTSSFAIILMIGIMAVIYVAASMRIEKK